ncbi:MAG: DNA methyltransferase, partial [Kiritimatiellae bacterium]|nr:DNA methyltransferase [Kiritimatiellia bacterium]
MESETKTVKAVTEYVAEVSRLAKTGKATEHTFRGALAALIDALAPGLKAVNEPKRTDCGAPDYIVQDKTGLGVFYVEAKDLGDDDLDGKKRTGHKEQFDRYKAALDTIIFTDYLDFRLYRHGQFASSVRIADWDGEGKVSGRPAAYADFAAFVADAAAGDPQKIDNAKRLAELMAGKARLLQRNAEEYLTPLSKAYDDAPDGAKPPVTPILELMLGLRDVLMPDVGAGEFSDIFAQTLTYGMFAARLNDPTPEDFSRYEAMALIPKTNPFLKQLFQYVANNLEDELEWMVDDLADLFRSADVAKIMRGYGRTGADPMIHFYEDFLAAYDAGLRKDRGVWYTPIQVVKFIVGAADWALRTRFGLPDGLADRSKVEIEREEIAPHGKRMTRKVKKTVHRVQLLDPATGTGTFIAESIRQIFEKFKGNEGMWPGYVESDLLPRLNGFELLMASYTMAHIKIDMALRETGATPSGKERFRVFLTDSLSDWHKELPGGLFASALAPEQQGADEVKRDTPVMVVMGNPPYSGESQNKG